MCIQSWSKCTMKNKINIDITAPDGAIIKILNNQTILVDSTSVIFPLTLDVKCHFGINNFYIMNQGNVPVLVNSVAMFDLGADKLVYHGQITDSNNQCYKSQEIAPNAVWNLEYRYPVFTWLHKTLEHGWILPE